MIAFIKGAIYSALADSVIIENNGIGYRVYVANPSSFHLNSEVVIYTYQQVREDDISLFGFSTPEEHEVFVRLISVKGVGARTALGMLAVCPANQLITHIENNDVKALKSLPGIGAKTASQIVLDLKGKLVEERIETINVENKELEDAIEALKSLGYRSTELTGLQKELAAMEPMKCDAYIRKALSIMAKKSGV